MAYIRDLYEKEIVPKLKKQFKYRNIHEVPKLKKIILHVGVGEGSRDPKLLEPIVNDLSIIAGQKAVITKAKKAISNFKIRKGMPIGVRVTLRGERMYNFLEKFLYFAVPRIRDYGGFNSKSFDGAGNYTLGLTEQLIFPEIEKDKIKTVFGMDITFVTSAKRDDEAKVLLEQLGMAFKRE